MKPGQSECGRCEKLFVFFYRTNKPIYCAPCGVIERDEARMFFTQAYRINRLIAKRNSQNLSERAS